MSADERLADWHPARFIELVADHAEDLASQAGVGGIETAGMLISYLAQRPADIEPFINGGFDELPLLDMYKYGRLSWHSRDGKVIFPGSLPCPAVSVSGQATLPGVTKPPLESSLDQAHYLIWSNEHRAWWRPGECGYTQHIERAGRYSRHAAMQIAGTGRGGWAVDKNPGEIAILEADAVEQSTHPLRLEAYDKSAAASRSAAQ